MIFGKSTMIRKSTLKRAAIELFPFVQSASMDNEHFENSMEFVRETASGASVHDGLFADSSDSEAILAYLSENGFGD